jgi:hypothetical protein
MLQRALLCILVDATYTICLLGQAGMLAGRTVVNCPSKIFRTREVKRNRALVAAGVTSLTST